MKITTFNGGIEATASENYLIVQVTNGTESFDVKLFGKMTLQMVREELKNTGAYTNEADLFSDADWCKSILNREKAATISNNTEPIA